MVVQSPGFVPIVGVMPKPGTGAAGVIAAGNVVSAAARAVNQPNNPVVQQQYKKVVEKNQSKVNIVPAKTGSNSVPYYRSSGGGGKSSSSVSEVVENVPLSQDDVEVMTQMDTKKVMAGSSPSPLLVNRNKVFTPVYSGASIGRGLNPAESGEFAKQKLSENMVRYGSENPVVVGIEQGRAVVLNSGLGVYPGSRYVINQAFDVPRGAADLGEGGAKLITSEQYRGEVGEAVGQLPQKIVNNPVGFAGEVVIGTATQAVTRPGYFAGQWFALGGTGKAFGAVAKKSVGVGSKLSYLGAKEIPFVKLVPKEVITGASKFSTSKLIPSQMVKGFESSKYIPKELGKAGVFHATDYGFIPFAERTIKVIPGKGLERTIDVPGLYTSTKGVSTYFANIGAKTINNETIYSVLPSLSGVKSSFRGLFQSPKIYFVESTMQRIPKAFRTSGLKAQEFFGKTPEAIKSGKVTKPLGTPGVPYISPAYEAGFNPKLFKSIYKGEAEAVIQVSSKLPRQGLDTLGSKLRGFKYFTTTPEGVRIPIYVQKGASVAVKEAESGKFFKNLGVGEYSSSSGSVSYKSLISSKELLALGSVSLSSLTSKTSGSGMVFSSPSGGEKFSSGSSVKSSISEKSLKVSEPSGSVYSSRNSFTSSSSGISSESSSGSVPSYSSPSSGVIGSSYVSSLIKSKSSPSSYPSRGSSSFVPEVYYSSASYSSRVSPIVPPPYYKKKKSKSFGSKVELGSKLVKAFSVSSKRKGKEVLLGRNLTYGEALERGTKFALGNASRTLFVKQEGFTQARPDKFISLEKFRLPAVRSKLNKQGEVVLVQKTKYAISSPGEKREIPGRAAELRRSKRYILS